MAEKGEFLFLGTGGSTGVPVVGCHCDVCRSTSPYDQRLRPSGIVRVNGKQFLIDSGPDFRTQALRAGIRHLDGVIFTHTHFDHIGGLDDLRIFYFLQKKELPCLLSTDSLEDLKHRYYYVFRPKMHGGNFTAQLDFRELPGRRGVTDFEGVQVGFCTYKQGHMSVNGFRFGNFAYVSDICDYEESIFEDLEGVDILVLSALRFTESHVHFTVDEAVDFAHKVGAKQTFLTHIAHELSHEGTNEVLPPDVRMGYDGLSFEFEPY